MSLSKFINAESLTLDDEIHFYENLQKVKELVSKSINYMITEYAKSKSPISTNSDSDSSQIAWHYRKGTELIRVMTADSLAPPEILAKDQLSYVSFSLNQDWEPSACSHAVDSSGKAWSLTREDAFTLGGGLVRFGYPSNKLVPWKDLRKQARIPYASFKQLESFGYSRGALPNQWMGCLSAIPASELIVEYLKDGKWIRIQDASPECTCSHEHVPYHFYAM